LVKAVLPVWVGAGLLESTRLVLAGLLFAFETEF